MNHDERDRRVQLSAMSIPGDIITATLIARYGTEATLRIAQDEDATAPPEGISVEGLTQWQERLTAQISTTRTAQILDRCERDGIRIVVPGDPDWPATLDQLPVPPIALYARGDTALLSRPLEDRITFTGSRAATGYGEHITTEAAADLAAAGRVIVTGGGYGIEAAAQRAALAAAAPSVAVMAGGLDRTYPTGNADLIDRVAESGAVISEVPPGSAPTRWLFLQRARILAATSAATIVTEAGYRSGTLHTAKLATELGRQVGAFPGPITSPASAGTHLLISSGLARLVTSAGDIRQLVGQEPGDGPTLAAERTSPGRAAQERAARLPVIAARQSPFEPGRGPAPAL